MLTKDVIDLVTMYIPRDQYRYQQTCTPRLRITHWMIRYLLRRDNYTLASGEHGTFVSEPSSATAYASNIVEPYVFSNLTLSSSRYDLRDINT